MQKNLLAQVNELKRVKDEEASLRKEMDTCKFKLLVAEALIVGLADEKISWEEDLAAKKIDDECIVGDIIICAGFIAYMGVFLSDYREDCKKQWTQMLFKYNIRSNKNCDLTNILGDPVKIQDW